MSLVTLNFFSFFNLLFPFYFCFTFLSFLSLSAKIQAMKTIRTALMQVVDFMKLMTQRTQETLGHVSKRQFQTVYRLGETVLHQLTLSSPFF